MERLALDPDTADVLHAVIHDLKGPASRLRLLAQLLRSTCASRDEETVKLLDHIENSAASLTPVVEALRSYTEICSRSLSLELVELSAVASAARAGLQSEISAAGAEVVCGALPAVRADRFQIVWLFRELLRNAIRFRSELPPRVRVSSEGCPPEDWFVSIADNGRGIEPAMAQRAFLPLKKLSGDGGAGIGLSICRFIVERHGGRIWIEPRTAGTEVRFCLSGRPAGVSACD